MTKVSEQRNLILRHSKKHANQVIFTLLLACLMIIPFTPLLLQASSFIFLPILLLPCFGLYVYLAVKRGVLRLSPYGIQHLSRMPKFLQGAFLKEFPADWSIAWDDISIVRLAPTPQFNIGPSSSQVIIEIYVGSTCYETYPYLWVNPSSEAREHSFPFTPEKPDARTLEARLLSCPMLQYIEQQGIEVYVEHTIRNHVRGQQIPRIALLVMMAFAGFIFLAVMLASPDSPLKVFFKPTSTVLAVVPEEVHRLPLQPHNILEHSANVTALAFKHNSRELASGDDNGLLKIWHAETGENLHTLSAHKTGVGALAFNPNSTLLASGGRKGRIRIWSTANWQTIRTLISPAKGGIRSSSIHELNFSPDGRLLAAANWNGSFTLWHTKDWQPVQTVEFSPRRFFKLLAGSGDGHSDSVDTIAFSPDGYLLATGAFDDMIKLWNVEDGTLLRKLVGHNDWVRQVRFSPDGKTLLSAGEDQALFLWQVASNPGPRREAAANQAAGVD
ncbi:MAG: WD40 repeat domain-containing protein [Pseudomonadota bacterium]